MKFRIASVFSGGAFHGGKNLIVGAGHQDVVPRIFLAQHSARDFRHLLRCFPFAQNDFGKTLAELALVIHFGEVKIFEGKMLQALDGFVRSELAGLHRFQNFTQFRLIHILRPQRILSSQTTIAVA